MEDKERILIIEDEPDFRMTLVKILSRQGYQVAEAANGEAAVELIAKIDFDLVITDVRLPGAYDGIDILKKTRELKPYLRCPFIVITGYAGDEAPIRAIKVGVDDFIYKPFEPEQLLHSVGRCLKIYELEKQREAYIIEIQRMSDELSQYSNKLEEKVEEKTAVLSFLFDMGKEITSSLKLDEVLATIVGRTADILGVEICSILLVDKTKRELFIAAAKGLPEKAIKDTRIKFGEDICGWVVENRQTVFVQDIANDSRFKSSNYRNYYTGSFISAPLIFKGQVIGAINVSNKSSHQVFNEEDLSFINSIADHAAVAIANARLYSDLKEVYLQVVTSLNSVIEIKDNYTKGHSERVTRYSLLIAERLGMPEAEIELLSLACQLHDLGKIGIHDHILTKPGRLTDAEWREMKLHPVKGVEILKPLSFLSEVIAFVEQHHERFDGAGYPQGRKGEEIPLGARIMAAADSFDAMTTTRPYSRAFTSEEAIAELQKCSGSQFDPKVVEAFVEILHENPSLVQK